MILDLDPMERALLELEQFLAIAQAEEAAEITARARINRAAVIQAFEFTYGLAVGSIRRQLQESVFTPDEVRAATFNDMLRMAADARLITDPRAWMDYRDKRNLTSHTYQLHLPATLTMKTRRSRWRR